MKINDGNKQTISLSSKAKVFFEGIQASSKLKEHFAKCDHRAQFVPLVEAPFFVMLHQGKLEFGINERFSAGAEDALHIVEVDECFAAIFNGDISLGEAIFHQKVRIPGYRNKEPEIANFSRTLRLGLWALVPGASILRPER